MTPTPSTRPSLLLRLRDPRDHEAWVSFIALYEPTAYRLLRRHGLQDADAREIMQELFLAVSRSIDRWDPDKERESFRGWLRRVTRNLLVNWLKRRERGAIVAGADMQALLDMVPADDGAESAEFDRELRRALFIGPPSRCDAKFSRRLGRCGSDYRRNACGPQSAEH